MLTLNVQLEETATGALRRTMGRLQQATELHEQMGTAVELAVRKHVTATKAPKSPKTKWWGSAVDSLTHTSSPTEAVVSFGQTGVALRYYGGTVRQRPGGPLLTVPSEHVPVSNGTRKAARMMGQLAFLRARRPARKGVVGVLVEGERYIAKRGRNKGQFLPAGSGVRPKKGGKLLYTLMTETDHRPDPTVLPTTAELLAAARDAALDYLETAD